MFKVFAWEDDRYWWHWLTFDLSILSKPKNWEGGTSSWLVPILVPALQPKQKHKTRAPFLRALVRCFGTVFIYLGFFYLTPTFPAKVLILHKRSRIMLHFHFFVSFPPSCIQLFRERLSEKMCTRQSRKVIWGMTNTLFLTTAAVEPTFVAFL